MNQLINLIFGASKSRMIILNTLTVIAGVMGYLVGNDIIAQHPDVVAALVSALGVLNVVLRFLTVAPVSAKVEPKVEQKTAK